MSNGFNGCFLKRIGKITKKQRGVTRTVDFLISFSLFIILLTQFFLVLINTNIFLSQEAEQLDNPAELLALRILGTTGTADWGTDTNVPTFFGLASSDSSSELIDVDLAKFARLNSDIEASGATVSYEFVNSSYLREQVTSEVETTFFRISSRPIIQVEIIDPDFNDIVDPLTMQVQVKSWVNKSLSNVNVQAYLVSATDGSADPTLQNNTVTSSDGIADVSISNYIPGSDDYVIIAYAYSGNFWGIDWAKNVGTINAGGFSSFVMPYSSSQNNSIEISSNNSITTSVMYYDNANDNLTINPTASSNNVAQDVIYGQIGTNGPIIFVQSDGVSSYRVITLPLMYDKTSSKGFDQTQLPV
ncbi:MAG: hypothetical protein ACXAC7_16055, partial [Candidatus Hodarchaeales archaeon]